MGMQRENLEVGPAIVRVAIAVTKPVVGASATSAWNADEDLAHAAAGDGRCHTPRRKPRYNRPVHGSRWEKRRKPLPKAQRP